ncbi:hypothetical protein ALC62_02456 [Cyphomyrmex costatus]|uniref:Uncharacterized protein n=1 Tax=Cyphomyrmex costatus TaxID=456900 RepID=A0A195D157_9HYME|nr:hypothetical protein ALC62_02456 [Cyphomyrmex costatus]
MAGAVINTTVHKFSEAHIGHDDENLQNVTLLVTKRARFFLRSFSWGNPKRNPKRRPPLRTTSQAPSLDSLNCPDTSMVFVNSSFVVESTHCRYVLSTTVVRKEGFLPRSSVLLGGSSDPLRTRRAQDADAAF